MEQQEEGLVAVAKYTDQQLIIPNSTQPVLNALGDEEFRRFSDALRNELETEPSDRTALLTTEGGQTALLTPLSSGHLVFYRVLTDEEVAEHSGVSSPAFLFFGIADGEEPEVKAALESLAS